jgi:hypothetical protein
MCLVSVNCSRCRSSRRSAWTWSTSRVCLRVFFLDFSPRTAGMVDCECVIGRGCCRLLTWWLCRLAGRAAVGMEVCRSKKLQVENSKWPGDLETCTPPAWQHQNTSIAAPREGLQTREEQSMVRKCIHSVARAYLLCQSHLLALLALRKSSCTPTAGQMLLTVLGTSRWLSRDVIVSQPSPFPHASW